MRIPQRDVSLCQLPKTEVAPGKELQGKIAGLEPKHAVSPGKQNTAENGEGDCEQQSHAELAGATVVHSGIRNEIRRTGLKITPKRRWYLRFPSCGFQVHRLNCLHGGA